MTDQEQTDLVKRVDRLERMNALLIKRAYQPTDYDKKQMLSEFAREFGTDGTLSTVPEWPFDWPLSTEADK